MSRMLFFIALSIFCFSCLRQENDSLLIIKEVRKNEMDNFIDSLKNSIVKDTSKFKISDLMFTSIGTLNQNSYSPLFIVNNKYQYKLDIVSGKNAIEFIDEFLSTKKIEKIILINIQAGKAIYGDLGEGGVLLITIRKSTRVNYSVAGFQMHKDQSLGGNNFNSKKSLK
jgi:hypothetical protein